jgi:pilus assembly protein CpaB
MAQTMTANSMGRVNRRFLFLALVLAALSAVLIYPLLTRSSESSVSDAATIPVVVAQANIEAGQTITADMLGVEQVPETAVGALAYSEIDAAVGEVARYPLVPGEQLLVSKVVGNSIAASPNAIANFIDSGKRAMAINTDLVVGAGGLVLPGDYVDVYWVPKDSPDDTEGAQLIAEDVQVLSVQQTILDIPPTAPGLQAEGEEEAPSGDEARVRGSEAEPLPEAATVTLMLSVEEIQRVFCAEETGEIRMAVRAFGDHTAAGIAPVNCVIIGTENQ